VGSRDFRYILPRLTTSTRLPPRSRLREQLLLETERPNSHSAVQRSAVTETLMIADRCEGVMTSSLQGPGAPSFQIPLPKLTVASFSASRALASDRLTTVADAAAVWFKTAITWQSGFRAPTRIPTAVGSRDRRQKPAEPPLRRGTNASTISRALRGATGWEAASCWLCGLRLRGGGWRRAACRRTPAGC